MKKIFLGINMKHKKTFFYWVFNIKNEASFLKNLVFQPNLNYKY